MTISINELICLILGHKWRDKMSGYLCERCKTFSQTRK